jgi:hypothetical protein
MKVGDHRLSESRLVVSGIDDTSIRASLEATVISKEMINLDGNIFPAMKIHYELRLRGNTIRETATTFQEWVAPYLGMVGYLDSLGEDHLRSFSIGGGFIDGQGSVMAFHDIFDNPSMDSDMDGIPDMEEQGPYLNDPDYDGNGDDIADIAQNNVFSSYTADGEHYITFSVPSPAMIQDAELISGDTMTGGPQDVDFACGFFRFTINGVPAGETVAVTITLDEGPAPITYYKFGPTPDEANSHWYEFLFDGETGAEIHGNTITLHFQDAARGDDVLSEDGMIVDIGAPGFEVVAPAGSDNGGGSGGGCFIDSLGM